MTIPTAAIEELLGSFFTSTSLDSIAYALPYPKHLFVRRRWRSPETDAAGQNRAPAGGGPLPQGTVKEGPVYFMQPQEPT